MKELVAIYNSEFFDGKFQPICHKKKIGKGIFCQNSLVFWERKSPIFLK
jgi:hypothetical protein